MYVWYLTELYLLYFFFFPSQNIHVFQDINFRLLLSYVRGIIVEVECSLTFIGILLLTVY